MDATIAALTGSATTLIGALSGALVQGRIAAKNASTTRLDEQRDAIYLDALVYTQMIEERLNYLLENPATRSRRSRPEQPDDLIIGARLFLVAPIAVVNAFSNLTDAWEALISRVSEDGPGHYGDLEANRDDQDVQSVAAALDSLRNVIRPSR
jgi:hypothetical protein